MATQRFRELIVWQRAHAFVLEVYKFTKNFPADERFGLTSQFKRAAVSIAANIAEGYKKKGKADKAMMFNIAPGSLEECQYYLILCEDLGFGSTIRNHLDQVTKMLEIYIQKILSSNS